MKLEWATPKRLKAFSLGGRFIAESELGEYVGGILLIPKGEGYVSWFGDWDAVSKFFGDREIEELNDEFLGEWPDSSKSEE